MAEMFSNLQTEDHQAKVPFSRNFKIRVTSHQGFKKFCHLDPLKSQEHTELHPTASYDL